MAQVKSSFSKTKGGFFKQDVAALRIQMVYEPYEAKLLETRKRWELPAFHIPRIPRLNFSDDTYQRMHHDPLHGDPHLSPTKWYYLTYREAKDFTFYASDFSPFYELLKFLKDSEGISECAQ